MIYKGVTHSSFFPFLKSSSMYSKDGLVVGAPVPKFTFTPFFLVFYSHRFSHLVGAGLLKLTPEKNEEKN